MNINYLIGFFLTFIMFVIMSYMQTKCNRQITQQQSTSKNTQNSQGSNIENKPNE